MKQGIYFFILLLGFSSCAKNDHSERVCDYGEYPVDLSTTNTVIPLHSQNFWVYSDSIFEQGIFGLEKSTLLVVNETYLVDGLKSFQFSSILPQLTIRNDTLFSTAHTPLASAPNCHELVYPMFFATEDSVQVDGAPRSNKFVYKSPEPITTLIGTFSNNIIHKEEELFEMAINEQVGIIKISFFLYDDNGAKIKRRILTLKDYDLN